MKPLFWNLAANGFAASPLCSIALRSAILRAFGVSLGRGVTLRRATDIYSAKLSIGAHSFVNSRVFLHNAAPITIGENVFIGPGVTITTVSHEMGNEQRRAGRPTYSSVTIGNGVWIGANALILPGVTIGAGCIIGAGAVVTRDCAANGLYLGTPAARTRELS